MTLRTVKRNNKSIKQYLRLCENCGDEEWKTYNINQITTLCMKCSIDYMRHNDSFVSTEELPQDEDKNQDMITQFYKTKKPSVTFIKDDGFKAYSPEVFQLTPMSATKKTATKDKNIDFTIKLSKPTHWRNEFDSVDDYYDYHEALRMSERIA